MEAVFLHSPDPMVLCDTERRIQLANPALERVFGYTPEELRNQTTALLYENAQEFERMGRARFNGAATSSDGADGKALRARFRRKNGEVFPGDTYGSALRDGDGALLGFLGVMHDASEDDEIRARLLASEERFRVFASAASDWFWEMDRDLRFSFFSDRFEEVTGVPPEKLLGRTREETGIPGVDEDLWQTHLADLRAHRPFRNFTHPRTRPGGEVVWLSISGLPWFDAHGAFGGYRGIGTDITHQVRMEHALRDGEARFREFAQMGADYFWETDAQMRLTRLYGDVQSCWGIHEQELIGRSRLDLMIPIMDETTAMRHAQDLAQRLPFDDLEMRPQLSDGSVRVIHSSGRPVYEDDGSFIGYRGVTRDVTTQRQLSDQLAHQASHDALTGLANRREFERRVSLALTGDEDRNVTHCLCYLDLDQFKLVNDTCGHVAGDDLLCQVSALLGEHLRAGDTLARLGGDEFGILLEHCPLSGARMVAESLRKTVEAFRFSWERKVFTVGVSVGVVPLNPGIDTVAAGMSAADSACYIAKENGRNRVHIADGSDEQVTRRNTEMEWVERVTRALEEDRFELWMQPIVGITGGTGGGRHVEILVRMRNEQGEVVLPGLFLPAAERYGLASRIDRWVLEHALQWFQSAAHLVEPVSMMSLNLSGQSLCEESFLDFTRARVQRTGIQPQQLCFEITETTAIRNLAAASRFIRTMRGLGCRFALDDFGSGLSSFAYLKTLDVDYLKLDGLFVRDIAHDPVSLAMVRSINEVGHVMGKRTIAEFVESDSVLDRLRTIGVDFAQGYSVGHPHPLPQPDDIELADSVVPLFGRRPRSSSS